MTISLIRIRNHGMCGFIGYRGKKQHFDIYWDAGYNNLADYYTKHNTAQHQKDTIKTYV